MTTEFDVIVVGAGLVGTSFVAALARQGFRIALIEKHLPSFITTQDTTQNFRPISLALASVEILRAINVWPNLQGLARDIQEVLVTEQGKLGGVHVRAAELDAEALGYVVPFFDLHHQLYQAVLEQADVTFFAINQIKKIENNNDGVNLTLDTVQGEQRLSATLLVACDGARSPVREMLDIPITQKIASKVALTAKLYLKDDYPAVAMERFTTAGTLAILPLKQADHCGMVWTMKKSQADVWSACSPAEFSAAVAQHFNRRLPAIESVQRGAVFPLETVIAKQQYKNHVILLGNAAHTLYPLAAQGFNLGLRDAAALAEVLVTAKRENQPFGAAQVLQRYVEWRQQDQQQVINLTEGIMRTFTCSVPFAGVMRGLGLLAMDALPPLKKRLARLTMGLSGRLPRLVRGLPL